MKQHKWHKEIKAWADGEKIEVCEAGIWYETDYPDVHHTGLEFRIKPQPKEPKYLYVYEDSFYGVDEKDSRASTRIMNKRVRAFEANYIGKIPLIVESNDD